MSRYDERPNFFDWEKAGSVMSLHDQSVIADTVLALASSEKRRLHAKVQYLERRAYRWFITRSTRERRLSDLADAAKDLLRMDNMRDRLLSITTRAEARAEKSL